MLEYRRLTLIALPCLILAAVLSAQSLSGILAKRSPETALAVFPVSGLASGSALEERAFDIFIADIVDQEDLSDPAGKARPYALIALAAAPLAPKAHAILALATPDLGQRPQILAAASALNRRDIALQGIVLNQHVSAGDYAATLETLDQMLRINVRIRQRFFPFLVEALRQPGNRDKFAEVLDMSAPWHELFLRFALDDGGARLSIAAMRPQLKIDDPEFDRRLILRLAAQGELGVAGQLYDMQRGSAGGKTGADGAISGAQGAAVDWSADFPPFDWSLTDEPDLRAQPSRDGERLEIFARSGSGGMAALRLIRLPPPPFVITTALNSPATSRRGAVRLEIECAETGSPVVAEPLDAGVNRVAVKQLSAECDLFRLSIHARSRRGEPAISAELDPLMITR